MLEILSIKDFKRLDAEVPKDLPFVISPSSESCETDENDGAKL